MTEEEWLVCTDPTPMLEFLRGMASDRKLRLFACACCRRIWHLLTDENRRAAEMAERYADGLGTHEEDDIFLNGAKTVQEIITSYPYKSAKAVTATSAYDSACYSGLIGATTTGSEAYFSTRDADAKATTNSTEFIDNACNVERAAQAVILRDISGNPFRIASISSKWLAKKVIALAQVIYDERRFQDLHVLANGLEEIGCTNTDMLDHCRQSGEHVRGCWVVDLLLCKE